MLPRADIEAAGAHLIGGNPVRQDHGYVGMRGEDQPVDPVEQGTVLRSDGVDVTPHCFVHPSIIGEDAAAHMSIRSRPVRVGVETPARSARSPTASRSPTGWS